MKAVPILAMAILFCIVIIGFASYLGNETDIQKQKTTDILNDSTIFRFGADHVVMDNNESPDFQDIISLLKNVTAESDIDLEHYYYPEGPVIGVGYGKDEVIVQIYKNRDANETLIREIYSVIERHGEQNGIKKIPCRFLSVDMLKLDSENFTDPTPEQRLFYAEGLDKAAGYTHAAKPCTDCPLPSSTPLP